MAKRAFDFIAACILLIVLSPVLLVVAVVVLCAMGWPVIFRQPRPGKGVRIFNMLKFRTMTGTRDADGNLLPDAQRLCRVGRILRASSVDELPELINVIRGDMSLVGPRPLLVEYLERYSPKQARRHEVRPGITGWAQVNGRNALGWEERFECDVWYVDNRSFALDARILLLTVAKVFRRDGVSQPGQATMLPFLGDGGPRKQP